MHIQTGTGHVKPFDEGTKQITAEGHWTFWTLDTSTETLHLVQMFLLECDESTPKDNKDYNPILEKGIETIHPTIFREMSGFLGYLEIFFFEKSPQPTGHPDPPGSPSTPTPPTQRFNICEP